MFEFGFEFEFVFELDVELDFELDFAHRVKVRVILNYQNEMKLLLI